MSQHLKIDPSYQKLMPMLQHGLNELGLSLSETQQTQLLYYLQQLLFWNKAYNLTAIKQAEPALIKHLLDSLAILPHLRGGSLLDIGTGAGLPGLVIAICQPERQVTALDSNGKKIRFIKQVASELGLKNVVAVASRIEAHEGLYEVITSRAFASLVDFVTVSQPHLSQTGEVWAMKGVEPLVEMQTLEPNWQISSIKLTVPYLDEERHLLRLVPKSV